MSQLQSFEFKRFIEGTSRISQVIYTTKDERKQDFVISIIRPCRDSKQEENQS